MVKTDTDSALARAFLSGQSVDESKIAEYVSAVDRQIRAATQSSITEAVALADTFLVRSIALSPQLRLVAFRSAGWAYLVAGKYQKSKTAYLSARRLSGGDLLTRGRIDRTLIDVYMYLGNSAEATRRARMAMTAFRRIDSPDDLARAHVNYANLLHRQDRHRQAHKLYHQAGEHFAAKGDDLSAALAWYNEANTLVQLFDFKQAELLYAKAKQIFKTREYRLLATGCLYGEAWLNMLAGNFHIALRDLSACETFYTAGGMQRELVLCQLDRAESYLGLNLCLDARREAEAALVTAKKLKITYEQGKAYFFAGRAAVGLGRSGEARRLFQQASTIFHRENNAGFYRAVIFDRAQLATVKSARRKQKLTASKSESAQLPLWSAIRDIQLAATCPDDDRALVRLSHNPAVKLVPHLAAQRHTILGDRAAKARRIASAVRQWSTAAEILDSVRAKLPPVELRSGFFGKSNTAFRKLIQTESSRDPMTAAVWAERFKTVGLWSPVDDTVLGFPARTKIHENLAVLAGQVAAVVNRSAGTTGRRSVAATASSRPIELLRQQLRIDQAALHAVAQGQADPNDKLRTIIAGASRENTIVQFHVGDDDLYAFAHNSDGCRVFVYDGGLAHLEQFLSRWRFLVECAHANRGKYRADDLNEESRTLAGLVEWLLAPLELGTGDRRLVLVPEGRLLGVPWPALLTNHAPLYRRHEIVVAPSIRHFAASQSRQIDSISAEIFVGSTTGLRSVRTEIDSITSRLKYLQVGVHNPALRSDWPENSSAKVWHYSGHAHLRADNPFYSSLELADQPIFAEDFRMRRNAVELVTLAACRTGQQTSLPGEESSGLVRGLLEMGARSVVAGGWAVADTSTALWMDNFYRAFMAGTNVAMAQREAMDRVREEYPSAYHWAAFNLYGAY